jgi:hypothetical protein
LVAKEAASQAVSESSERFASSQEIKMWIFVSGLLLLQFCLVDHGFSGELSWSLTTAKMLLFRRRLQTRLVVNVEQLRHHRVLQASKFFQWRKDSLKNPVVYDYGSSACTWVPVCILWTLASCVLVNVLVNQRSD